MANEWLREEWACLQCGQCKWFNVRADMSGVESRCRRLDHKHLKFAVPWFKSYDCGQFSGCVCNDFEPAEWCKFLHEHWNGFYDYFDRDEFESKNATVSLVVDGDTSVRFLVLCKDFVEGTFLNEDGSLKYIAKYYYKKRKTCEKFPTGYELVTEINPAFQSEYAPGPGGRAIYIGGC